VVAYTDSDILNRYGMDFLMHFLPKKKPDLAAGAEERFYDVLPFTVTSTLSVVLLQAQVLTLATGRAFIPIRLLIILVSGSVLGGLGESLLWVAFERKYYQHRLYQSAKALRNREGGLPIAGRIEGQANPPRDK
jgi:hypothetical protein